MSPVEICEIQSEIIRLQTKIIDDLFAQVIQYATIEEEEAELEMIQKVSDLRKEVPE